MKQFFQNDPYDALREIADQALKNVDEFRNLEKAAHLCVVFGIDFEFLENQKSDQIKTYRKDDVIFRIYSSQVEGKKSYYFCCFQILEFINNREEKLTMNEKIKLNICYILMKKIFKYTSKAKVHYVISSDSEILIDKMKLNKPTIFTKNNDKDYFSLENKRGQKVDFPNKGFFLQLSKLNYDSNLSQFIADNDPQLFEYLQQQIYNFSKQINLDQYLQQIYENMKIIFQQAKGFKALNEAYKKYLGNLFQNLISKDSIYKSYFQIFYNINQDSQNFKQQINQIFQILLNSDQEDLDSKQLIFIKHKKYNIQYEFFTIKFEFDQLSEIYHRFQAFEGLNWGIAEKLLKIRTLSKYHLEYLNQFGENQFSLPLDCFDSQIIDENKNKTGVFIFGKALVGKSTIFQIVKQPEQIQIQKINENDGREFIFITNEQNIDSFHNINNTIYSDYHKQIQQQDFENFILHDCPGLYDTQPHFRIINILNIKQTLNKYQNHLILILIQGADIIHFIENFKDTMLKLKVYNANLFTQENFKPIFIICQTWQQQSAQNSFLDSIFKNREQFFNKSDNQKFKTEFQCLNQAKNENRVIYFERAQFLSNGKLQLFQKDLMQSIQYQINQKLNFKITCDLDFSNELFIQDYQQFIKEIRSIIQFILNFQFTRAINFLLTNISKNYKEKKEEIINLQQIIQNDDQHTNLGKLLQKIEEWIFTEQYDVSYMEWKEFDNLYTLKEKIGLNFTLEIQSFIIQVEKLLEIITSNESKIYFQIKTTEQQNQILLKEFLEQYPNFKITI